MARSKIVTGIDIGSSQIKVVIVERAPSQSDSPRIIGLGQAESKGMRHGYILNTADAIRGLAKAIQQAENSAGVQVRRAYLSVGGIGLESFTSSGSTAISRADYEVTANDIKLAHDAAESAMPQSLMMNRKIIHAVPLLYKLDNREVLGRPQSMKGIKLEAKLLFVTALEQHLNDMLSAVDDANIEVVDVMASPFAASLVNLSTPQKKAGCVLTNIGSETLSMVVYENNIPLWLGVFPIGSADVTSDVALGLQISLEEAEEIKRGVRGFHTYPQQELEAIMGLKINDMFELVEVQLKKIGKSGLLPAGIVISGGGSGFTNIEQIAKKSLRLPSRIASHTIHLASVGKLPNTSWSVAFGLCLWGLSVDEEGGKIDLIIIKKIKQRILNLIKQFLP